MKFKSLLLLITSTISTIGVAQIVEVQLASDTWPPFTGMIENQAVASQIVREALNRNEVAANTKIIGFEHVMDGIKAERYDGSAALWKDEQRDEFLIFSKPYLENQLVLVGRKGTDVSMRALDELQGKKLALVDAYSYGITDKDLADIGITYGKSDQANLIALLKGDIDYMLVDALLIHNLMQTQPLQTADKLSVGDAPIITKSLHFALRKDLEGADALIKEFNQSVDAMKADGTYNRILKLNWIMVDVDGDGELEYVANIQGDPLSVPSKSYDVALIGGDSTRLNEKYYVDGKLYNSWEEVPVKYKRGTPSKEDVEDFTFLQFDF